MLTTTELEKLTSIIEKNHLFFIASQVGKHVLTDTDKDKLLGFGIDVAKLPDSMTNLRKSYLFGQLAGSLDKHIVNKMTYKDFEKYIISKNWLPLSRIETSALTYVENYAYNSIVGLGNKVVTKLGGIFLENDKQLEDQRRTIIKDKAKQAILERKSKAQLASELREATKDWSRDWGRVADNIMHTAFSQGTIDMLAYANGSNSKVYMDVYAGACKHCIRLYLTNGIGSRPKVFSINNLQENGSNIGRKVDELKATIPPIHPWCRCTVQKFVNGSEWDEELGKFRKPKIVSKKPGLVTITIRDKTYTA